MKLLKYDLIKGNITGIKDNNKNDIDSFKGVELTTYNELKTKRDNSELVPGTLYRITDYQCTTVQANTRSAGHQFDIVLLALSENTLAEEGWAMMHESNIYDVTFVDGVTKKCYIYEATITDINIISIDTLLGLVADTSPAAEEILSIDKENKIIIMNEVAGWSSDKLTTPNLTYNYFQNSKLEAWKVWYSLDNDRNRFVWAAPEVIGIKWGGRDSEYLRKQDDDELAVVDGIFAWYGEDEVETIYTNSETPKVGDPILNSDGEQALNHTVESIVPGIGKGVVYRLIDEWNNDCPYDFKNIQYKRKLTNGEYDASTGANTWVYTFNAWNSGACFDLTIKSITWTSDENACYPCMNNKINTTRYETYDGTHHIDLPNNVFLTISNPGDIVPEVAGVSLFYTLKCTITCDSGQYLNNVAIYGGTEQVYHGNNVSGLIMVKGSKKVVFENIT